MKKGYLVLALVLSIFVGLVYGAYTTYTNLKATNDLYVGNDATVVDDLTVGGDLALTGNASIGGNATLDYLVLSQAVNVAVTTPTVVGQLVRTSAYVVYIGTGTARTDQWVKVGGQ